MLKKTLSAISALALAGVFGIAGAQAGGMGHGQHAWNNGKGHGYGYGNKPGNGYGNVHINQNGNGCRNRCYGNQAYNAGWGNSITQTTSIGKKW